MNKSMKDEYLINEFLKLCLLEKNGEIKRAGYGQLLLLNM